MRRAKKKKRRMSVLLRITVQKALGRKCKITCPKVSKKFHYSWNPCKGSMHAMTRLAGRFSRGMHLLLVCINGRKSRSIAVSLHSVL